MDALKSLTKLSVSLRNRPPHNFIAVPSLRKFIWILFCMKEKNASYSFPCSRSAWTVSGRPQRLMKPVASFWL